jgi:hypothetical protein
MVTITVNTATGITITVTITILIIARTIGNMMVKSQQVRRTEHRFCPNGRTLVIFYREDTSLTLQFQSLDHIQIPSGALGKILRGIIAEEQEHSLDLADGTPLRHSSR